MAIELTVPSVGESVAEVEVGNWLKKAGDYVEKDEAVVEIESDKATVEVYAPVSGTITEVIKDTGEAAEVGELIGYMEEGEAKGDGKGAKEAEKKEEKKEDAEKERETAKKTAETEKAGAKRPAAEKEEEVKAGGKEAKAEEAQQKEPEGDGKEAAVMPAARRLLEEHGVDADDVEATGPGGRLLKEDVLRHLEQTEGKEAKGKPAEKKAEAEPAAAPGRHEEAVRMTPLRRRAAETLVNAQQDMALLTTFNECDLSAVMKMRNAYKDDYERKYEIKLGFMSFFVKAVIEGLKTFPAVNAEIRGDEIIYKNYYDIGIAVSGKKGLVVPVLRNAERMSFGEVELAIADMGRRARDGRVRPEELEGGTFTITNGGIFGSLMSTPILNPPQSAILGMHAIQERPVVRDGEIVVRPMMYVALTYDHRIIDGREAVSFLVRVKECIEDPARILLEV